MLEPCSCFLCHCFESISLMLRNPCGYTPDTSTKISLETRAAPLAHSTQPPAGTCELWLLVLLRPARRLLCGVFSLRPAFLAGLGHNCRGLHSILRSDPTPIESVILYHPAIACTLLTRSSAKQLSHSLRLLPNQRSARPPSLPPGSSWISNHLLNRRRSPHASLDATSTSRSPLCSDIL